MQISNSSFVKVVGIGGAGHNMVRQLLDQRVDGVDLIVMDTDRSCLEHSGIETCVCLGAAGLGVGMRSDTGRALAEASHPQIGACLHDAQAVILVAGLGKGTGGGATPVIADIARSSGALVFAFAILPFSYEGSRSFDIAEESLKRISRMADSVFLISNARLEKLAEDASMIDWQRMVEAQFCCTAKGISHLLRGQKKPLPEFDDSGAQHLLRCASSGEPNFGMLMGQHHILGAGSAEAEDEGYLDALQRALMLPLLKECDWQHVQVLMVNIVATRKPDEAQLAEIRSHLHGIGVPASAVLITFGDGGAMSGRIKIDVVAMNKSGRWPDLSGMYCRLLVA